MRNGVLASFFIVFAASAVWSQQAPAPKPDQPETPRIVRDPHSTKADLAVPLCPATFNDSLATDGIARADSKIVVKPVITYRPTALWSDEALRQGKGGRGINNFEVDISLVVDTSGKIQDVCLIQSAGYGLDANAAEAVQKYQFKPATYYGKPVADRIAVKIDFYRY
jgi:TonB family protein